MKICSSRRGDADFAGAVSADRRASTGEMRGSLHYATDGEAVYRFGRDDNVFVLDGVTTKEWALFDFRCGVGEMRGSLHCATDGGAVCRFGRDDDVFVLDGVTTKEWALFDFVAAWAKCGGLSTARQTVGLSVAWVEMTMFLFCRMGERS
jgi:hypothetical protein